MSRYILVVNGVALCEPTTFQLASEAFEAYVSGKKCVAGDAGSWIVNDTEVCSVRRV